MKALLFIPFVLLSCSRYSDVKINQTGGVYRPSNYRVEERSSREIPKWIKKPQSSSSKIDPNKQYYFFSFVTEPKVSREIACNLIKAYGRDQIGDQIVQVLEPTVRGMEKPETYLKEDLLLYFQEGLKGAQIVGNYWEKRKYFETNEEGNPIRAWVCALWVKVSKREVSRLLEKGRALMLESFPLVSGLAAKTRSWDSDFSQHHSQNY